MTDDYFQTSKLLVSGGNTLIKTNEWMFVAAAATDKRRVTVYSSNWKSGFTNVKKVKMPQGVPLGRSFTIMDTSEEQVFLYLEEHGDNTFFGNMYISDTEGRSFSLSIENVIKGTAVDFEKVNSLDGTFVVNKFDAGHSHQMGKRPKKITDFNEADLEAEDERKSVGSRMGRGPSVSSSSKNQRQEIIEQKQEKNIDARAIEKEVRTYITHNKGGKWELIPAPSKNSAGDNIECFIEDGCSLHLEIYSHMGELSPVYSVTNAVGLVMGTGNLGSRLTENDTTKYLYISRDGGLKWNAVKKGVWIYDIGDHGALIVIGKKNVPTQTIEFSWNEGKTWESLVISDKDVLIQNIILEPNSVSQ